MKKQAILAIALLVSVTAFSQKTHRVMGWKISKDIPRNEVKLNLPMAIFGSFPEVSYEHVINSDFSVGGSLGVGLEPENYPVRFSVTPYARWFFGGSSKNLQKYGAGFFIEANGAIMSRDTDYFDSTTGMWDERSNDFGAGLGLAFGWKYLSQNNWVGEVYFGGGRDFAGDAGYPRFGLSIGKRF